MKKYMKEVIKTILHSGLPVPRILRPAIKCGYHLGVLVAESLVFLKKYIWIEPVMRSICEDIGKGLRADCLPFMRGDGVLSIGDRVTLSGRSCFFFITGGAGTPKIKIGSGTYVAHGCTFSAAQEIAIGEGCLVSSDTRIHDNNGHPLDPERRRNGLPITPANIAPVIVGDNVWTGARVTILKGVTIGENSIIGTGSVVTKDVPPNTIVAGNPAREVGVLESRS